MAIKSATFRPKRYTNIITKYVHKDITEYSLEEIQELVSYFPTDEEFFLIEQKKMKPKEIPYELTHKPVYEEVELEDETKPNQEIERLKVLSRKNRAIVKIYLLLVNKPASTYQLAKCIDVKLTKTDFQSRLKYHQTRVNYRIRTLNKILKSHNSFISRKSDMYLLQKKSPPPII